MSKSFIIAIDGPAGAGKSSISRRLAEELDYLFIDTGAMYRALALKALELGVPLDNGELLTQLAQASRIELKGPPTAQQVFIDDREVSQQIRSPRVSEAASIVSTFPGVRRALVAQQQAMGRQGGVVLEGRDVGTVVFPQAHVKFYLDASPQVRARRRFEEDTAKGIGHSMEATLADILNRDQRDLERADSPLRRAADAIYLDTSELTLDQILSRMLAIISSRQ